MKKIKTHQLITLIGVVIYMVLAVMLQNYKELTVNMEFLIASTLLPALLFIYFPFFVINFLKKVFTKEAQSERNKTIMQKRCKLYHEKMKDDPDYKYKRNIHSKNTYMKNMLNPEKKERIRTYKRIYMRKYRLEKKKLSTTKQ